MKKVPFIGLKSVLFGSKYYLVALIILFVMKNAYYNDIVPRLSEQVFGKIDKLLSIFFVVLVAFIVHKIARYIVSWYRDYISHLTETTVDDELMPLIKKFVNTIIWVVATVIVLSLYGVNINALIATLGFGSLAIALAAKDTFAKIIAGVWIMVDRPFRIGDKIKLPSGQIVIVKDIGLRDSRFLGDIDKESAIIIVPNVDLSNKMIINFTYGGKFKKPAPKKEKFTLKLKGKD